jgi:hypothetical protein
LEKQHEIFTALLAREVRTYADFTRKAGLKIKLNGIEAYDNR